MCCRCRCSFQAVFFVLLYVFAGTFLWMSLHAPHKSVRVNPNLLTPEPLPSNYQIRTFEKPKIPYTRTKYTLDSFRVGKNGINLARFGLEDAMNNDDLFVADNVQVKPETDGTSSSNNTNHKQRVILTDFFKLYQDFALNAAELPDHDLSWKRLIESRNEKLMADKDQARSLIFYHDKIAQKRWMTAHNIPTPKTFKTLYQNEFGMVHKQHEKTYLQHALPKAMNFVAKPNPSALNSHENAVSLVRFTGERHDMTIGLHGTKIHQHYRDLLAAHHLYETLYKSHANTRSSSWAHRHVEKGILFEERIVSPDDLDETLPPMEFHVYVIWGRVYVASWHHGTSGRDDGRLHNLGFVYRNGTVVGPSSSLGAEEPTAVHRKLLYESEEEEELEMAKDEELMKEKEEEEEKEKEEEEEEEKEEKLKANQEDANEEGGGKAQSKSSDSKDDSDDDDDDDDDDDKVESKKKNPSKSSSKKSRKSASKKAKHYSRQELIQMYPGQVHDTLPEWVNWGRIIELAEALGAHKDMCRVDFLIGEPAGNPNPLSHRLLKAMARPAGYKTYHRKDKNLRGDDNEDSPALEKAQVWVSGMNMGPLHADDDFDDPAIMQEAVRLWIAGYKMGIYETVSNKEVPQGFLEHGYLAMEDLPAIRQTY